MDYFFNSINIDERPFVRKYLNWVCQQTIGNDILDIDSYKGIVSILLINLGKKVTEITIDDESISFLKSQLSNMDDEERSRFRLLAEDVSAISDTIGTYDTIVMTDHHLNFKDDQIINLLKRLIRKEGRLIFTHPFGVYGNDFDEKASSYGMTFFPLIENGFRCSSIEIFGVELDSIPHYWLCAAFDDAQSSKFDSRIELDVYISKLEEIIAKKEYEALNEAIRLKEVNKKIQLEKVERDLELADSLENVIYSLSVSIKQLREPEQLLFKNSKIEVSKFSERIAELEKTNEALNQQIDIFKNELDKNKNLDVIEASDDYFLLQQKHEIALMKLKQAINMLEKELDEKEEILRTYQDLQKNHQRLEVRYNALSGSLLGRMTLRYWEFLKNKPRSKKGS